LADVTGGKSYFIKDDDSSEALQQAFVGASTYQSTVKNEDLIFKLFEKELTASVDQTDLTDEFVVDDTVGRNLKLSVFNLDDEMSVESVELTGPDGDVVNNFVFDTTTATLTVELAKVNNTIICEQSSRN
jgi:calcium-activated chloride channel regulator 4